jgi:RNA recognition motif-containing protein
MQGSSLYVGNLGYSVTEDQLRELFSSYGEVKGIRIIPNRDFGFVDMSSSSEAEAARTALNGSDFQGRTLKVDEARPPRAERRGGYRRY